MSTTVFLNPALTNYGFQYILKIEESPQIEGSSQDEPSLAVQRLDSLSLVISNCFAYLFGLEYDPDMLSLYGYICYQLNIFDYNQKKVVELTQSLLQKIELPTDEQKHMLLEKNIAHLNATFFTNSPLKIPSGSGGSLRSGDAHENRAKAAENPITDLQQLRQAADRGDIEAQYQFGLAQKKEDPTTALQYLLQAADRGHIEAQYALSSFYETYGPLIDGKIDYMQKSLTYLEEAANNGHPRAQREVAFYCSYGKSSRFDHLGCLHAMGPVKKDDQKATKYYIMAADQGDSFAQLQAGIAYENGIGTPPDKERALKYYIQAAAQGCSYSKHKLMLVPPPSFLQIVISLLKYVAVVYTVADFVGLPKSLIPTTATVMFAVDGLCNAPH